MWGARTPSHSLDQLISGEHKGLGAPQGTERLHSDSKVPSGRLPGSARVVRAHRHADRSADRLDPESAPPLFDVAGHRRRVGSSS